MKNIHKLKCNWKFLLLLLLFNIGLTICFLILTLIFINSTVNKVKYCVTFVIINFLTLLLLGVTSTKNGIFYFYHIENPQNLGLIKNKWFWLNTVAFSWITFFVTNALLMFINTAYFQTNPDFYKILKNEWWVCLLITIYHSGLIITSHYCILKHLNK